MRKRRRYHEDRINHDRWLVSYADFITLLFAFFVVMYALSTLNEKKYRVMSNSVVHAFGQFSAFGNDAVSGSGSSFGEQVANGMNNMTPELNAIPKKSAAPQPLRKEREQMKELAQGILTTLAPLIREGKVHVTQTDRGISIDISDSVLFASGTAKLTPKSSQALIAITSLLENDTHDIQVEGFTDNLPIKNGLFPSNWELSAVRAGSVVRLFIDHRIAENRLTAIGQGSKTPVGDNDTEEGRSRNRRVNITILAMLPEQKKEVPMDGRNGDELDLPANNAD